MKYLVLALSLFLAQFSLAFDGEMPQEIKLEIAKYLGLEDLARLSSTSKEMRKQLNPRWKRIFEQNLGELEEQDPKSYLPGEPETPENIDWKETFLDKMLFVKENNDYFKNNKAFRNNNKLLIGIELTQKSFIMFDFSGANFYKAKITLATLDNSNFTGANLANSVILYTSLVHANLTNANLTGASLRGSDLDDSNLTGAILQGTDLTGAYLRRAFYYDNNNQKITVTLQWLTDQGAHWLATIPPKVS